MQATVRFGNGSVGTISYVTGGNARYPKETIDASGGGRNARLDNFRERHGLGGPADEQHPLAGRPGQGPAGQVARFVDACLTGAPMPISSTRWWPRPGHARDRRQPDER